MHWIQRHILKQLATKEACRYKDLKPESVDGNLFMYHLNQLITGKYIEKNDGSYFLTKEGKKFVGGLSLETGKQTMPPRVFVMIYAKNKEGKVLMYKWNRQPYLGHVSLPFSRIRYGQTIKEAAEQNLQFKTSLTGTLEYAGTTNVVVNKDGKVATHYIAHIYGLEPPKGELAADGLTGEPFWGKQEDISEKELVNGTQEIIEILEKHKGIFFEEIQLYL